MKAILKFVLTDIWGYLLSVTSILFLMILNEGIGITFYFLIFTAWAVWMHKYNFRPPSNLVGYMINGKIYRTLEDVAKFVDEDLIKYIKPVYYEDV